MKLSLCMIVKPTDQEAELLARCLGYVQKYVDEICITVTGNNDMCDRVAKEYGAKVSRFDWTNDFASARNYNFSQATGDYIFWLDADDVVKGASNIPGLVKKMNDEKIDVLVMNYLYAFDKNGECTTKHLKSRIVKKGSVKWVGEIHEDFSPVRQIESFFTKDVEIMHITSEERTGESFKRNTQIALETLKKHPDDPRSFWLVANAYFSENKKREAIQNYEIFIQKSRSDDEKYLAYLYIAELLKDEAPDTACYNSLKALELRPTYPNAYLKLGEYHFIKKNYQRAIQFTEIGLQMPVPEMEIIAFNPRGYDYFPLMILFQCYYELGKYQQAQLILDKMFKLFPKDEGIKKKKQIMDEMVGELNQVDEIIKKAEKIKEKSELKKYLDLLSPKLQAHPKVCLFRNVNFVKEDSTGRDLAYYCSYTEKEWDPEVAETAGVGGSEEAVINLSKRLAKLGWNVTVYNNCPKGGGVFDGVTYKPFWAWNYRDKQDVTILWRHPKPLDYPINSDMVVLDMHDVIPEEEFTSERLREVDRIFVKTKAHRDCFPKVPDSKFVIIPNGIDPSQFDQKAEKNPYLILNTSSPDRHLEATLDVFEELIKREPGKPWKLAWFYGWGVYDGVHEQNKEMMDWKAKQVARFDKLVKDGRAEGGYMINHREIAKKYLEAGIFLYPTQFYEIHCISAVKAQLANCYCVTSDFAALAETVQHGTKVHTEAPKWGVEATFGDSQVDKYLTAINQAHNANSSQWAMDTYNWDKITNNWNEILCH